MSLGDIMGAAGLSGFAEIALIIFFLVFVVIVVATFSSRHRERLESARLMPLRDEPRADDSPSLEQSPTSTDREQHV